MRLAAGGGSSAATKSYIDLSGYSTTADVWAKHHVRNDGYRTHAYRPEWQRRHRHHQPEPDPGGPRHGECRAEWDDGSLCELERTGGGGDGGSFEPPPRPRR
jgi:hypothetical protein